MEAPIELALISLTLSLILTPAFREVFRFLGLVDHPNQARKIHSTPIPRAGGLAVAVSYLLSLALIQLRLVSAHSDLTVAWRVLPGAGLVLAVGLADDLWGLKPWQKLIGQLAACAAACYRGILVLDVVGVHRQGWWTIPITVCWLLACTNAFNLVDGMDGLAGGVGVFTTLTIFIAALMQNNFALAISTIPLVGCLLGFLRYNFFPATVFLGDSGSLFLGFVLGCYGVIWTQKSATLLGMTAPIMALSLPLLDVALAVARRFLRQKSIFAADRGHIHHRLLDRGISTPRAALVLYGICSLVAVFSLFQSQAHNNRTASVTILVFCALAWLGIQYLGYTEFMLAGRYLLRGSLQRALKFEIELNTFSRDLREAENIDACLSLIENVAEDFGLRIGHFRTAGRAAVGGPANHAPRWEARIVFPRGDFINLYRDMENPKPSMAVGAFIDVLYEGLQDRLAYFSLEAEGEEAPVNAAGGEMKARSPRIALRAAK